VVASAPDEKGVEVEEEDAMALLEVTMSADGAVRGNALTWMPGETIGRGSFGQVFQALEQKTGRIIAVKQVPINDSDELDCKFQAALRNEIDLMQNLQHPHIVSYLGHDRIDSCLYLYMEYVAGGSLSAMLKDFGPFEEALVADYSRQLLAGLRYLHEQQPPVVHRDIKGGNVLVSDEGVVKLTDFGCSKKIDLDTTCHTRGMPGSVNWMAPEVVTNARYGIAADVWSFGCVVIEMLTAQVPWGRFDNQMVALRKIGMSQEIPPWPSSVSEHCADFLGSCLKRDSSQRPSTCELAAHPLVKEVRSPFD
jgi:mitogen-activated protein kinase kinase kinase